MALKTFNLAGSLLIALLSGWAVLSPNVKDGLLIKFGLILVSVGSLALGYVAWNLHATPLLHSLGMIYFGHALVFLGWVLRAKKGKMHLRRSSDWMEFDDLPSNLT